MNNYESIYDMVLDIIRHPGDYTPEQLTEILSNPETREIYNLICKTESAVEAKKDVDVNAEWDDFSKKHSLRSHRSFYRLGSSAASIAAIVGTSIAAVAAGIAVTVAVIGHKPEPTVDDAKVAPSVVYMPKDTIAEQNDTAKISVSPIMFENEPLEKIMKEIAVAYGVEINFNSKEAASLHLYYKLDTSLSLNEVIGQLNTFEQINITQNGNTLNID